MSKKLKDIVKKLKHLKNWTVEDVAKSVDRTRVHLQKEMKAAESPIMEALLLQKHGGILQNVASNHTEELIEVLKAKSIEEKRILEHHNRVLEDVIKANLTVIIQSIGGVRKDLTDGLGIASSISTRTEDLNQQILKILNERLPPPAPAKRRGNNGG